MPTCSKDCGRPDGKDEEQHPRLTAILRARWHSRSTEGGKGCRGAYEEHNLRHEDIDRIEALVNWLETEYPSPAFASRGIESPPQVGSTQYFTAWGAAERGYPLLRADRPGPGETDPPEVLDLMHRVTLIPTMRRTLFGPRITVFTKDGRSFTKEGTGREFIWDFEEQARRIRPITPGLTISEAKFAEVIDTSRHLDRLDRAAPKLISLTIPS